MDVYACLDCGVDTRDEYYHVLDPLWTEHVGDPQAGMLCVGCLENRVGRELVTADFSSAPVNWFPLKKAPGPRSARIKSRLQSDPGLATIKRVYAAGVLLGENPPDPDGVLS